MVLENHEVLAIVTGICAVLEWSFLLIPIIVQVIQHNYIDEVNCVSI